MGRINSTLGMTGECGRGGGQADCWRWQSAQMPPTSVRRDGDFDIAVARDLPLQILVELAFKFAHFSAADAGDVDVVARAVAFVIMAVPAKMQQVELVDQAEMFEQFEGAIDGDAGDVGIDFLGEIEDFAGVQVLRRAFHDLKTTRRWRVSRMRRALSSR